MFRQYVGARYVPKFADPVAWASGTSYEAMTIVTYNNSSYTSKIPVPATVGDPADNPDYWALTGNYNAQVEQYRQETETQISNERTAREEQDAVLSARMNEFTKLPDGSLSTAADAELVDIRVKADGTSAATAGNAVREQITGLKNALDNIAYVDEDSPNLFNDSTYVEGYYIDNNNGTPSVYANWGYFTANVEPGTYYLIGAPLDSTEYKIITDLYIGYYNESDTFISGEVKTSKSDGKITVPANAKIARISTHNYSLGHSSDPLLLRTKIMLVTTEYYTSNVHSTEDYTPYHEGSGTVQIKAESLPDSVVFNSDLDGYDLVPAIEDYFKDEVTETVNSVLSKCDAPCTVLTFVTDSHVDVANKTNLKQSEDTFNNLRTVNEKVWSDGLVHLGDLLVADDNSITQLMADRQLNYIRTRLSGAKMPLYITQGNHDGLGGSAPKTQNYCSLGKFNSAYVVRDGDAPYFYVDMEQPKVRLVFLALPQRVNIGGTEYDYWGLYTAQLNWFGQVALNVDDGRNVIICSHIGTQSSDFKKNLSQTVGICNAFNAHSTFGVYYENTSTLLYTADFTSLISSKIVLWVCGHEHYDWNIPESVSGLTFPLVTFTCSRCFNGTVPSAAAAQGAVAPSRTDGTVTQDAWTTMIYRPDEQKIYFVRFGAGSDFTIDLTDYTSFSS